MNEWKIDMKKSLGFITMCLIWGTTWMAIKIGLKDLTPFISLGLRFILAGACMTIYVLMADGRITFDRKQLKITLYITLFNYIFPYSLVYWGEQFIFSDLTAVIFAMLPINMAILSSIFLKEEKLTIYNLIGVLIGFSGIITIFSETVFKSKGFHLYGMIAVYLASVFQAIMAIYLKKNKDHYHPIRINIWPLLLSGTIITGFGLLMENIKSNTFTVSALISIFYLSIFGTVITFTIYFWIIKHIKLILLSSMAYILPIIAVITGWIFLNEQLSPLQLVGFSLIVLSIILIAYKKPSK